MVPPNVILFSMDVESLYTNIDNTSGIQAVKQAFARGPHYDRPEKDVLELLQISINNNVFHFQDQFYRHIWGQLWVRNMPPIMQTYLWQKRKAKRWINAKISMLYL